jgi:hypothetical protein
VKDKLPPEAHRLLVHLARKPINSRTPIAELHEQDRAASMLAGLHGLGLIEVSYQNLVVHRPKDEPSLDWFIATGDVAEFVCAPCRPGTEPHVRITDLGRGSVAARRLLSGTVTDTQFAVKPGTRAATALVALLELGAVNVAHKVNRRDVVKQVYTFNAADTALNDVTSELRKKNLTESAGHRGGGIWLTTTGQAEAERLKAAGVSSNWNGKEQ